VKTAGVVIFNRANKVLSVGIVDGEASILGDELELFIPLFFAASPLFDLV
jgi:hypothetical protein